MISSYKTKYSADSIETRPGHATQFACATYQLDSDTQHREGNIALLHHLEGAGCIRDESILETGGVLDLWWRNEGDLFAAKASGELQLMTVTDNGCLESNSIITVSSSILLTVDGNQDFVLSSDTSGNIYKVSYDGVTTTIPSVHGREGWGSEVWGLAVHKTSPHLVYSGGDDCLLRCHDWRTCTPVFTSKHHTMGVCCISHDPLSDYNFCSGSYDENLSLWDSRNIRSPLSECRVGGGVWRIKRSLNNRHLLIAGMHSGFHVVDLANFQVSKTYTEHESLAYGADWLKDGKVATCSFYDNLVNVWHSGVIA